MAEIIALQNKLKPTMRSTEKVRMVRIDTSREKPELIDCWLPVGRGWNQGGEKGMAIQAWKNMNLGPFSSSWMTWEEYEDKQRSDKAAVKAAEVAAELEAVKKENEELKTKKGKGA